MFLLQNYHHVARVLRAILFPLWPGFCSTHIFILCSNKGLINDCLLFSGIKSRTVTWNFYSLASSQAQSRGIFIHYNHGFSGFCDHCHHDKLLPAEILYMQLSDLLRLFRQIVTRMVKNWLISSIIRRVFKCSRNKLKSPYATPDTIQLSLMWKLDITKHEHLLKQPKWQNILSWT